MARTIKIAIMDVSNIIGPGLGRVMKSPAIGMAGVDATEEVISVHNARDMPRRDASCNMPKDRDNPRICAAPPSRRREIKRPAGLPSGGQPRPAWPLRTNRERSPRGPRIGAADARGCAARLWRQRFDQGRISRQHTARRAKATASGRANPTWASCSSKKGFGEGAPRAIRSAAHRRAFFHTAWANKRPARFRVPRRWCNLKAESRPRDVPKSQ
jgi:hypothetical protein